MPDRVTAPGSMTLRNSGLTWVLFISSFMSFPTDVGVPFGMNTPIQLIM